MVNAVDIGFDPFKNYGENTLRASRCAFLDKPIVLNAFECADL